jgi:hypothetical protein
MKRVNSSILNRKCPKMMSPLNCNETLSPCKDGDDESEELEPGESHCECSDRSDRQVQCLKSRFRPESAGGVEPGKRRHSIPWTVLFPGSVGREPDPAQVPRVQRFSSGSKLQVEENLAARRETAFS